MLLGLHSYATLGYIVRCRCLEICFEISCRAAPCSPCTDRTIASRRRFCSDRVVPRRPPPRSSDSWLVVPFAQAACAHVGTSACQERPSRVGHGTAHFTCVEQAAAVGVFARIPTSRHRVVACRAPRSSDSRLIVALAHEGPCSIELPRARLLARRCSARSPRDDDPIILSNRPQRSASLRESRRAFIVSCRADRRRGHRRLIVALAHEGPCSYRAAPRSPARASVFCTIASRRRSDRPRAARAAVIGLAAYRGARARGAVLLSSCAMLAMHGPHDRLATTVLLSSCRAVQTAAAVIGLVACRAVRAGGLCPRGHERLPGATVTSRSRHCSLHVRRTGRSGRRPREKPDEPSSCRGVQSAAVIGLAAYRGARARGPVLYRAAPRSPARASVFCTIASRRRSDRPRAARAAVIGLRCLSWRSRTPPVPTWARALASSDRPS